MSIKIIIFFFTAHSIWRIKSTEIGWGLIFACLCEHTHQTEYTLKMFAFNCVNAIMCKTKYILGSTSCIGFTKTEVHFGIYPLFFFTLLENLDSAWREPRSSWSLIERHLSFKHWPTQFSEEIVEEKKNIENNSFSLHSFFCFFFSSFWIFSFIQTHLSHSPAAPETEALYRHLSNL